MSKHKHSDFAADINLYLIRRSKYEELRNIQLTFVFGHFQASPSSSSSSSSPNDKRFVFLIDLTYFLLFFRASFLLSGVFFMLVPWKLCIPSLSSFFFIGFWKMILVCFEASLASLTSCSTASLSKEQIGYYCRSGHKERIKFYHFWVLFWTYPILSHWYATLLQEHRPAPLHPYHGGRFPAAIFVPRNALLQQNPK